MTVHRHPGRDLYADLGVSPAARAEDVRRAYRRLARELHPDLNPDPAALERFRTVASAYAVVSDPVSRADYDATRAATDPAPDPPPHPAGVDYVPAGPAVAYTDYVPTAPDSWGPPPPQPASWAGQPTATASHGVWPAGWPAGRIDPHRGLGPVLIAAWRIAPLPRSRRGKALVVAGVAFVYWIAGPAVLALLPAGPRPWAALVLLLVVWLVAACWILRALTWIWFTLTDSTRRATARLRRSAGANRPGRSGSEYRHGRGY